MLTPSFWCVGVETRRTRSGRRPPGAPSGSSSLRRLAPPSLADSNTISAVSVWVQKLKCVSDLQCRFVGTLSAKRRSHIATRDERSRTLSTCPTATKTLIIRRFFTSPVLSFHMMMIYFFFSFHLDPSFFFKREACFFSMPFMDSESLLTTMFSILMFRIFVVWWLFVFLSFFVLLMLINGGMGGKLKAIRCCCTVVVMPSSFVFFYFFVSSFYLLFCKPSTQWPVFWKWGAKSISGYFTFWWCLCMCIYVYISICISTWLRHSICIGGNYPSLVLICRSLFFFSAVDFWFWV